MPKMYNVEPAENRMFAKSLDRKDLGGGKAAEGLNIHEILRVPHCGQS